MCHFDVHKPVEGRKTRETSFILISPLRGTISTRKLIMTNSTNLVKKAFSVAVAATTILWSVGLSAFLPVAASAATFGDLIKGTTLSTVYYYGSDGQRYAFPNEKTYFSWNKDFSAVKTISDSQLASITLAGNIVYRPGARWIKITSDNKVYVVSTNGKIRWVENEATAKGLAGDNWNAHIDDVPDVFFTNYTVGDSLTSAAAGYDGMLWSDGTSKYLVAGTKYQKLTDAGFAANGYNAGFVLMGTGFTKSGLTAGADITVAMANLMDQAQKVTTPTYAVSQNVSVSLSASSPASSTLIATQAVANLAAFDFTNPTSSAVTVKSLALKRIGVSSDSVLSNVYLFSGSVRLTDAASVSSGVASFNDAAGLFTIPAGGTSTVNVRSDILTGTAGQTVGVQLVSADKVGFTGAFAAAGTFPISGAIHTIATASLATVSFVNATATPAAGDPAPQSDYTVWQNNVLVQTHDVWLQSIRFRNIGSISADDVGNFRLYVASVMRGSAVAKQDANGYITFDLSAAPLKLTANTHTFKVVADILGGSTRTMTVGFRAAADAVVVDDQYQQGVLMTGTIPNNAGTQTINGATGGNVSFVKRADSPSGDLVIGTSNAVLARYDVKASGEPMKIESLNFNINEGDNATDYALRNGAIYADGVQIGNTTSICADTEDTSATCSAVGGGNSYTTFNFGSSLVVYPGTPVVLEVRADLYNTQGTPANVAANKTIIAVIDGSSATTNVFQKTTLGYIARPSADVSGNQLTVKSGALTVLKNSSYAAQTVVVPKTAYKVGSWTVSSNTTESVDLTSFSADFAGAGDDNGAAVATDDYSNLYIEYGLLGGTMSTSTTKSTVSTTNSFSVSMNLAAGKTVVVNAYADVASTASVGVDGADWIIGNLDVTGNATGAGPISETDKAGQKITFFNAGTFTPALDGSSPVDFVAAGNQTVTVAKYRLSSINEPYTLKEMKVALTHANVIGSVNRVELYDGTTLLGSSVFDQAAGLEALVTGMSLPIPVNSYKVITAKLVLNQIGTGAGATNANLFLVCNSIKKADSQGVQSTTTPTLTGNDVYVFKAVPVLNAVDLTNSSIVNGNISDLYKFTVTASGGDVAIKQFALNTVWSDGNGDDDTLTVLAPKFYKNGTQVTAVVIQDEDGNDVSATGFAESDSKLYVTFTNEDVVASGETVTYSVKGTPSAFATVAPTTTQTDSVSFSLVADAVGTETNGLRTFRYMNAGTAQTTIKKLFTSGTADGGATVPNFLWSDNSSSAHTDAVGATASPDWTNGYLILNLDLATEVWSKAV